VSRSGYNAFVKHRAVNAGKKAVYQKKIKKIFDDSGGTYGVDRVCGLLRKQGEKASYRRVGAFMAQMGLSSIHNHHRTRSLTDSRKARGEGYVNLTRGQIFTQRLQAVCSDITYIKDGEGWLYYCIVKDIVTGEILGEATSENLKKELVIRTFLNAQARHNLPKDIIFHSDRGSQYTSGEFKDTLKLYGVKQSFSRVGMPGDNAWAESFFANFKKEIIHPYHYANHAKTREAIFMWTEGFYNTRRVQKRLGYLSPKDYAALLDGKKVIAA
jgi:putative transposase